MPQCLAHCRTQHIQGGLIRVLHVPLVITFIHNIIQSLSLHFKDCVFHQPLLAKHCIFHTSVNTPQLKYNCQPCSTRAIKSPCSQMAAVNQRSRYSATVIIILVIIYRLFNDAVTSSDYVARNDEMAESDLERMQKEVVMHGLF